MNTNKKQHLPITILLIGLSFFVAYFSFWSLPELFETWNARSIDRLFLLKASSPYFRTSYDDTIAHIDITDSSLQKLNIAYLERYHYARVIQNLAAMNVSSQLFDFIFVAKTNDAEDSALIDAVRKAGNVYMGLAFNLSVAQNQRRREPEALKDIPYLDSTKWNVIVAGNPKNLYEGTRPISTFPELASASRGLGFLNLKSDCDGVNRRIPLLVKYKGSFYPSLSLRSICDYLSVPPEQIILRPGRAITLQDARRPEETSGHDIVIPIDLRGNMLIDFIGPWESMKHYNFADVFYATDDREEMVIWRDELSGKILLISEVTTGTADLGPVPTDADFLSAGIHANVLHTILRGSFLTELSGREMLAVEIGLLVIIFVFSLRFSSLYVSLGSIALAASYVGIASGAFLYGKVIFHIVRPLFIMAFAIVSIVVYRYVKEERDRHFIRRIFGRYLSNEVVEELLGSPEGLKMSGETREVTFLVSDLRGFTSLSSTLSPENVIKILNHYFKRMIDIITRYRGTVDELQGDGMLVFFGAPLGASDDPERAVACAIEMQNVIPKINEGQRRRELPDLSMGIGINTGEVVVGNIGSEKRTKYGAVGSAINTTYRIESYTSGGQILISPSTYKRVRNQVLIKDAIEVSFKGIDQPVMLYDVKSIKGTYEVSLAEKPPEEFRCLETPMAVTCFVLAGKAVWGRAIPGRLIRLCATGAEAFLDFEVALHSNLKILLVSPETSSLSGIYAKVTSVDRPSSTSTLFRVRLTFTFLGEDTRRFLDKT